MATRRLLLLDATPAERDTLLNALRAKLADLPAVRLPQSTIASLHPLLYDARAQGAALFMGGWTEDAASLFPHRGR